MPKTESTFVIVGKIGAPFGVQGWLKIHSYTEFGASILEYNPWYLSNSENESDPQAIEVEDGRIHGKIVLAKLAGLETPEAARLYTGKLISIPRSLLPKLEKNEYYWSDLEGLTVINQTGLVLGKIAYLMETGSNDVLVVKGEKDHAIPYLPGTVVMSIDLEKQEMHVNWEPI